jgi:stearoyl-CoA desaturase (Delta-9 desaturase)
MPVDESLRTGGSSACREVPTKPRHPVEHAVIYAFVILPFAALGVALPCTWGWGLSWLDLVLAGVMYVFTMTGISVGFHRYFTHGSFKTSRPVRILLAVAGIMAVQGPVTNWVAIHRRHHAFADRPGDPHSPWRYGTSTRALLLRGVWHAHIGWILDRARADEDRYVPDLMADKDIRTVDRLAGPLVAISMLTPPLVGGLITNSWHGAFTAFFWASAIRLGIQQHVTWSVNSLCHLFGERPFRTRDQSSNLWPLAVLSLGDSWHNLHHADPTCARHGVDPGQIDISARIIWLLERAGFAHDVRWPKPDRLSRLRRTTENKSPSRGTTGVYQIPNALGDDLRPSPSWTARQPAGTELL